MLMMGEIRATENGTPMRMVRGQYDCTPLCDVALGRPGSQGEGPGPFSPNFYTLQNLQQLACSVCICLNSHRGEDSQRLCGCLLLPWVAGPRPKALRPAWGLLSHWVLDIYRTE